MPNARDILLGAGEAGTGHVFIAMPTGQVVANIVPIFEVMTDQDSIVWLATAVASDRGWLKRSVHLIKERFPDVKQTAITTVAEYHAEWDAPTRQSFGTALAGQRAVLVANGGTKPLGNCVGAALSAAGFNTYPVLYLSAQPPSLVVQPEGHSGPAKVLPLGHAEPIRLHEVLGARGYVRGDKCEGKRIWSSQDADHAVPASRADGYGSDPDATAKMHDNAFRYIKARKEQGKEIPTAEKSEFKAAEIEKLKTALNTACRNRKTTPNLYILFNTFRNIGLSARNRLNRQAADAKAGSSQPAEKLGDVFEAAVAARVLHWLAVPDNEVASRICEVWSNVSIFSPEAGKQTAQLDVALVLRNGSVLHLECKSSLADYREEKRFNLSKDMSARRMNLLDATGKISTVLVCLPMYSQFSDEAWQIEIYNDFRNMVRAGMGRIFFTFPDQDETCTIAAEHFDEPLIVPPFEQELTKAIRRF